MGLMVKDYEIAKNVKADAYVNIASYSGQSKKIIINYREWLGVDSREVDEPAFREKELVINDENINCENQKIMQIMYELLKKYFQELGYVVSDEDTTFQDNIIMKMIQEAEDNNEI